MLALRLPADLEARLDALAKATGRTKAFYVREAILTHLEDLEDSYLAEKAYLEFKASGEKAVMLADLVKEYGLDLKEEDVGD
jgi:RHH-type rel operon transcriptional repressor/antitoxin RelB